jgi:hypothetical protein
MSIDGGRLGPSPRPSRSRRRAPGHGQVTTPSSQSPSESGPQTYVHTSSTACSVPLSLKTAIRRSSTYTLFVRPGPTVTSLPARTRRDIDLHSLQPAGPTDSQELRLRRREVHTLQAVRVGDCPVHDLSPDDVHPLREGRVLERRLPPAQIRHLEGVGQRRIGQSMG